ncbi:uncharacterized protein LOC144107912 isoform X1 [Amblyomma americanum]
MRRDEAAMKVRIHGEPPIGPFPDIVAVDNELRRPTACQAMQRMLLWAFRYINTRTWMELLYSAISRTRTQTGLAPQTGLVPTQQMTSRKLLVFKSPQSGPRGIHDPIQQAMMHIQDFIKNFQPSEAASPTSQRVLMNSCTRDDVISAFLIDLLCHLRGHSNRVIFH